MSPSNWKPLKGSFKYMHSSEKNCFKLGFGFASVSFIQTRIRVVESFAQ